MKCLQGAFLSYPYLSLTVSRFPLQKFYVIQSWGNQPSTSGGRCCHEWNNLPSSTGKDLSHFILEVGCLGHCGHPEAAQPVSQCQLALEDYRQLPGLTRAKSTPQGVTVLWPALWKEFLVRPCLRPTVLWKYIVVLNLAQCWPLSSVR